MPEGLTLIEADKTYDLSAKTSLGGTTAFQDKVTGMTYKG